MRKKMKESGGYKTILTIVIFFILVLFGVFACNVFVSAEGEDADDYIEIRTVQDLYNIRNNLSGKYKLMNDINLSEATASGGLYDINGQGWKPIGSDSNNKITGFKGILDGQGYTIKGLRIEVVDKNVNEHRYYGLFAYNKGTIKNVALSNVNISCKLTIESHYLFVGSIAGVNEGQIENVIVNNGSITGNVYYKTRDKYKNYKNYCVVSGLACNTGTMNNCSNSANVYANATSYSATYSGGSYVDALAHAQAGGLSGGGLDESVFLDCCNYGEVYGRVYNEASSVITNSESYSYGIGQKGTFENCFNASEIGHSLDHEYGIADTGTINNCYFIGNGKIQDSGSTSNSYYMTGKTTGGNGWTGLNDVQMKNSDYFQGFDFEEKWEIIDDSEYLYPQLKALKTNVTKVEIISEPTNVIVEGTTLKYDGAVARIYRANQMTEDVELTPENTTGGDTSTAGKKTVTFTYKGFSASFEIEVLPVQILDIEIKTLPDKTEYVEGQAFDSKGLTVYAIKNNGQEEKINEYSLSDITTTPGEKTVTVSYQNIEKQFKVKYIEKKIVSLDVTTDPIKKTYDEGEAFDSTGMVVKATYNDGDIKEITDYTIGDISGYGSVSVEITYSGMSTSIEITVRKLVKSINLDKDKAEIYEKEEITLTAEFVPSDADNKELVWTSSDETVATVNENGEIEGVGEGTANIKASIKGYDSVYAVCEVSVSPIYVNDIEITQLPTKTVYKKGEVFDPTGMVVNFVYNNGSKSECDDYTIGEIVGVGDVNVAINWGDYSKSVQVSVVKITDIEISHKPTKTRYKEGEAFDPTGMVVSFVYENGEKSECTDYSIGNMSGVGNVNITITWGDYSKNVQVSVVKISDIEITSQPYKTKYNEGEEFNPSGLRVTAVYSDGIKENITNYTLGKLEGTGKVKVSVSFSSFVKYIDVFVVKSEDIDKNYTYASDLINAGTKDLKLSLDTTLYLDRDITLRTISGNNVDINLTIDGPGTLTITFGTNYINDYIQKTGTTVINKDWIGLVASGNITLESGASYAGTMVSAFNNLTVSGTLICTGYENQITVSAGSVNINGGNVNITGTYRCMQCIGCLTINDGSLYLKRKQYSSSENILTFKDINISEGYGFLDPENGKYGDYVTTNGIHYYTILDKYGNNANLVFIDKLPYEIIPDVPDNTDVSNKKKKEEKKSDDSGKKSKDDTIKYQNEWINGKWYDANGNQTYSGTLSWKNNSTGWWVEDTAGWYPQDQWQKIDGIWYYFKPDGYMASNEYYNGYWFNSDGSWDEQYFLTWKSNSTGWWVEDKSGWWPSSKWLKINGYWYYFDSSGYMVTNQYIDGYWIGSDGVCS